MDDERQELIRKLFAVLTGIAEDAAGSAADGQAVESLSHARERSAHVIECGQRLTAIAEAVLALSGE